MINVVQIQLVENWHKKYAMYVAINFVRSMLSIERHQ